jgi:hypothetical protein
MRAAKQAVSTEEKGGHPLGRGSNRKSLSVPIFCIDILVAFFQRNFKGKFDSSLATPVDRVCPLDAVFAKVGRHE